MKIPLSKIVINPEVVARARIDEEHVQFLVKSLSTDGQLQPILVRPLPDGSYELLDGLHRVEAARRLGWKDIEALVLSVDDVEARFLALKANIARKSLEPVEEGEAVYRIMVKYNLTEKEVAERLGTSVDWVSKRLALVLKVHEDVRKLVSEGKLSLGHAVVISKIKDPAKQVKFAKLVLDHGWSVKQAEEALVEFLNDTIYTIGYENRTFEEFVELLKKHDIKVVIDIRHEVEFVKQEFSAELLKRQLPVHGIKYVQIRELGVPLVVREPYIEGKMSFDCFKQWYLWQVERTQQYWESELRSAKKAGFIALLCVERYPTPRGSQKHYCHRHLLADYLVSKGYFEKRYDII